MSTDESRPAAVVPAVDVPAAATDAASQETFPVLRVVSGNPSSEEVAALVAVLAAAGSDEGTGTGTGTGGTAHHRSPSRWSASARTAPPRPAPGHGAWRASGLPR